MRPVDLSGLSDEQIVSLAQRGKAAVVARAREDFDTFVSYVLRDEETGKRIRQAWLHKKWNTLRKQHKRLVIFSHVEAGKAMPLDTPVATPGGWVGIGDLRPGDTVYDRRGEPAKVRAISEVQHDRTVYELEFDDGGRIKADADHQWSAWTLDDLAAGRDVRVVTTAEMVAKIKRGRDWFWKIPMAGPVAYPQRVLPVHPYMLGVWLGDGDARSAMAACALEDREMVERAAALDGVPCRQVDEIRWSFSDGERAGSRDGKLRTRLRQLGVLGNKHIPELYLRASVEQRTELLKGLLDSDGSIDARGEKSCIEFTSVNALLASQVLQLVRSLGFKARISEGVATLSGRVISPKYRVTFTANRQVFALKRKADKVKIREPHPSLRHRTLRSARVVPSVPVRCITVDSPDSTFLAGHDYTVTHNTQQLSVALALFVLGRNPRSRIAVLSNTQDQAKKIVATIKGYIEKSPELQAVFPNLKPGDKWAENQITVKREGSIKEPSIQAFGATGKITGARLDVVIVDDIHGEDNVRTKDQRDKIHQWFYSTPMSRLGPRARVILVGNAWHPDDLLHRLEREGWPTFRFPVLVTEDLAAAFPNDKLEPGAPTWPERWPLERIDTLRKGAPGQPAIPPLEFARAYLCVARDDHDARFKQGWMDHAKRRGEVSGIHNFVHSTRELLAEEFSPEELASVTTDIFQAMMSAVSGDAALRLYTGVDLSTGEAKDRTVLFTLAAYPNGDRRLLNLESGRWQIDEIVARILGCYQRFGSIFMVENVSTQQWLVQLLNKYTAIPVLPITTGKSKADPVFGVESLAAELANGKWIIPSKNNFAPDEAEAWIEEMLYYNPQQHTGDRLMAAWFARTGAERSERGSSTPSIGLQVIG